MQAAAAAMEVQQCEQSASCRGCLSREQQAQASLQLLEGKDSKAERRRLYWQQGRASGSVGLAVLPPME